MYERGYIATPGFEITPQFAYAEDGIKSQGQIRFEFVSGDGLSVGLLRPDRRIRNVLLSLVLLSSEEIIAEEHMFDDETSNSTSGSGSSEKLATIVSGKHGMISQRTKEKLHNECYHHVLAEIIRLRATVANANESLKSSDTTIPNIDWHYGQK